MCVESLSNELFACTTLNRNQDGRRRLGNLSDDRENLLHTRGAPMRPNCPDSKLSLGPA